MDQEGEERTLNINNEGDLETYLAELEINKNECARDGRYDEADDLKSKIDELRNSLKSKKKKDLDYQHLSELNNLEESYKREIEDFTQLWDARFNELEERSKNLEESLKEKHTKEMDDLYSFLEVKLSKNVKYSKEYLELKNQEENLVIQQRFKEASLIRKKAEIVEKVDTEKWNKEKNEKIKAQTVKTAQKHLIEKNALKKKIEIELEIMKKEKESGLKLIIHKYKNRKFGLDLQQKQEKNLSENDNLLKAKTFSNPRIRTKKFMSLSQNQFVNGSDLKKSHIEKSLGSIKDFTNSGNVKEDIKVNSEN